jgi:hypothetical protein
VKGGALGEPAVVLANASGRGLHVWVRSLSAQLAEIRDEAAKSLDGALRLPDGPRLSMVVTDATRSGLAAAYARATEPPSECPTRCTALRPSDTSAPSTSAR